MDAATLQAKINGGFAKAAQRLGYTFSIYRPSSPTANPIVSGNLIGSLPAAFTVTGSGFNFEKPSTYKNPLFNGLFDGSQAHVGDYLVNATHGAYFLAQLQDQAPPLCVQCNRTVSVTTPGPALGYGAQATYSGSTPSNEQPVLTQWPASILLDARGRVNEIGAPMDLPSPFFQILLPLTLGADIRTGAIVTDDQGRRYIIAASEHGALGWRIAAQQAVT